MENEASQKGSVVLIVIILVLVLIIAGLLAYITMLKKTLPSSPSLPQIQTQANAPSSFQAPSNNLPAQSPNESSQSSYQNPFDNPQNPFNNLQ